MIVTFELCDYMDYNPLKKPFSVGKGVVVDIDKEKIVVGGIVSPFLQSYEYFIVNYDIVLNTVQIIPYCDKAKKAFDMQYRPDGRKFNGIPLMSE